MAKTDKRYAAFISYSHSDEEIADWLHKRLETFRIPNGLTSKRRIGKVFRDRVDLASAHDLGTEIKAALDISDALVLICSPRSAKSEYVAEEIRLFKAAGKAERIFAVIASGEPHAAGRPGFTQDDECFPPALIYQVRPDGTLSDIPETVETLAADFREGKDGRENGSLKIIAGLLNVGLDDLVQRERRRQRRRIAFATGLAASFAVIAAAAIGLGLFSYKLQLEAEDTAKNAAALATTERARNLIEPLDRYTNWTDDSGMDDLEAARTLPEFTAALDMTLNALEFRPDPMRLPPRVKDAMDLVSRRTPPVLDTLRTNAQSGIHAIEMARQSDRMLVVADDGIEIWDAQSGERQFALGMSDLVTGLEEVEVYDRLIEPRFFARWCGQSILINAPEGEGAGTVLLNLADGSRTSAVSGINDHTIVRCNPEGSQILAIEAGTADEEAWYPKWEFRNRRRDVDPEWRYGFAGLGGNVENWQTLEGLGEFVDITWNRDGKRAALVGVNGAYIVTPGADPVTIPGRFMGWSRTSDDFVVYVEGALRALTIEGGVLSAVHLWRGRDKLYFTDVLYFDVEQVEEGYLSSQSRLLQSGLTANNLNGAHISPDLYSVMFLFGLCDRGNGPMHCRDVRMQGVSLANQNPAYSARTASELRLGAQGEKNALALEIETHGMVDYFGSAAPITTLAWLSDGQGFVSGSETIGLTGGTQIDVRLRHWRAPTAYQGAPQVNVPLSPLCDGELLSRISLDADLGPFAASGGYCNWNSGTRGGAASTTLNSWITSLEWVEPQTLRLGLTSSDCSACVYENAAGWVEYDLEKGAWTSLTVAPWWTNESDPPELTFDDVTGKNPMGHTLFYARSAQCDVVKEPAIGRDPSWKGGRMHTSGVMSGRFVCIRNVETEENIPLSHESLVNSVRWSKDGQRVLTASEDGFARIFDVLTGDVLREYQIDERLPQAQQTILAAEWSPDNTQIAIMGPAGLSIRPVEVNRVVQDLQQRRHALKVVE